MANKPAFSQRHPAIFGVLMIIAAMVLFGGAMAVFLSFSRGGADGGSFLSGLTGDSLGQVNIEGEIKSSDDIVAFIKELRDDDGVKGVLLRIDSPGGAFGPSQEIYQAVKSLSEEKPVVASFSSVAASGGYYAACPAKLIYSNPGAITGSIGVLSQYANFQELMAKLGVSYQSFTSGELKDAGSPFKPMTPAQKAYIEALIADLADQFTSAVADNRHLSEDALKYISDGRAMTGRKAKEIGLVDELGGRDEALAALKNLCGMKGDVTVIKGPEVKESWLKAFTGALNLPSPESVNELASLLRDARTPGLRF